MSGTKKPMKKDKPKERSDIVTSLRSSTKINSINNSPQPQNTSNIEAKRIATTPTTKNLDSMGDSITKTDLQNLEKTLLTAIQSVSSSFNVKLTELKSTVEESISKIEASQHLFTKEIDTFKKQLIDNTNTTTAIQKSVQDLYSQCDNLSNSVNAIQQQMLQNNLLIANVPSISSENLQVTIVNICQKLGVQIQPTDITYTGRISTKNKLNIQPITVQLKSHQTKLDILKAAKNIVVSCTDIGIEADFRIYIHNQLTSSNQLLLTKARNFRRKHNYEFAWFSRGFIFIRKTKESQVIRVPSVSFLQELELQQPSISNTNN